MSGLDARKATIAVCVAEAGRDGEVRFVGEVPNEPAASDKLVARLGRGGRELRFVHEAGPCGYGVYRHLRGRGVECLVVAPSCQRHRKFGARAGVELERGVERVGSSKWPQLPGYGRTSAAEPLARRRRHSGLNHPER